FPHAAVEKHTPKVSSQRLMVDLSSLSHRAPSSGLSLTLRRITVGSAPMCSPSASSSDSAFLSTAHHALEALAPCSSVHRHLRRCPFPPPPRLTQSHHIRWGERSPAQRS